MGDQKKHIGSTEYFIFTEGCSLLPPDKRSYAGFTTRKTGVDKTLVNMEVLIKDGNNLRRNFQNAKQLQATIAEHIATADKFKLIENLKPFLDASREIRTELIEFSSPVEESTARIESAKKSVVKVSKETKEKIKKELGECAQKNLKLSSNEVDPIFTCEDIEDFIKYLDSQSLSIDKFCDLTNINKKDLYSLEKTTETFCQALLLASLLASQGPLNQQDDKATKKKIKKDAEKVIACMGLLEGNMSALQGSLDEIMDIGFPAIKDTTEKLLGINQELESIENVLGPIVERALAEKELEAVAKEQNKNKMRKIIKSTESKETTRHDQYEDPASSEIFQPD